MMEDEDSYGIGRYSSSDDDQNESSDDDLKEVGFLKERRESGSSSEDEFEKEMQMELESVLRSYEQQSEQNASNDQEKGASDNKAQNAEESAGDVYSEDYFSSGSEDEHLVGGQGSKSKERRKMLTNDELLYDPDMDDEDEKWVLKQRQEHRMKVQQRQSTRNSSDTSQNQGTSSPTESKSKVLKQKVKKVPSSDAILSCPACMTTLCIDCQRHDLYKNQYRAMFVMNCKVVEDEVLKYEPVGKKKKKEQKGKLVQCNKDSDSLTSVSDGTTSEHYHPVACTECSSEVAVYDSDEVYHFFNVLASHA